jgi:hypothetical protein
LCPLLGAAGQDAELRSCAITTGKPKVALGSLPGHTRRSTPSSRRGRKMIRKMIVALVAVGALALGAAPAFGAEHHPPKFGPHDNQCQSGANQPNCPGKH